MLPSEPCLPRDEDGRMVCGYVYTVHPLQDGSHGFESGVLVDSMNENVVLVLVPQNHPRSGFVLLHRSDLIDFITYPAAN